MTIQLAREAAECLAIRDVKLGNHSVEFKAAFAGLRSDAATASRFTWGARSVEMAEVRATGTDELLERQAVILLATVCRVLIVNQDGSVPEQESPPEQQFIAELEAEFRAVYAILPNREPTAEQLEAFAKLNVQHHVWPWWRQWLASTASSMGLPSVMLPMHLLNRKQVPEPGSPEARSEAAAQAPTEK